MEQETLKSIQKNELEQLDRIRSIQLIQGSNYQMGIYYHKNLLSNDVYIGEVYFQNHYESIMTYLKELIKNKKENFLKVGASLVGKDIIGAISYNPYLTRIELGSKDKPYLLTKEDVMQLSRNGKLQKIITYAVTEECQALQSPIVEAPKVDVYIQGYSVSKLKEMDTLYLKETITKQDLDILLQLPSTVQCIYFLSHHYENIVASILEMKNGYQGEVVIDVGDKNFPLDMLTKLIGGVNVRVLVQNKIIPLEQYIKTEQKLYSFVAPLYQGNYSNLEKYVYLYDQVKNMKQYHENEDHYDAARDLYQILFNDFIVCEGYSVVLVDLLQKVGIPAVEMTCAVYKEQNPNYKEYHSRVLVHLEDPSYRVDGYYIADPTWDHNMEQDYNQYTALTPIQVLDSERKFYMDYTDLLNCVSREELLEKLYFNPSFLKQLWKALQQMDVTFYQYFMDKYPNVGKMIYALERQQEDEILEPVTELFYYFKKKTQNPISMDLLHLAKEKTQMIREEHKDKTIG